MEFKETSEILDALGVTGYEKDLVLGVAKSEYKLNQLEQQEKQTEEQPKKVEKKITKEEIMAVKNPTEQSKLIEQNRHLFNF
ncbi:hypothetical protein ETI10_06250 [Macrococcoides goetzii]|nr:hypothetical protein [Macrococcus goetzii]TDM40243.1 hypothetical protein ETI10_06250 [Macrococcus goetzii]